MTEDDEARTPDLTPATSDSIVVGHDGSACAADALTAALGLAEQLHLPVLVVRAWSIVTAPRPATWELGYVASVDEYSSAVLEELARDTSAAAEAFPSVSVSHRAVYASPTKSLIDISRHARMLVVGSRGRGGLAGMLLGSVSEQCVRHAECPVLVVRRPDRSSAR